MRPFHQHRQVPVMQFRATPDGVEGRFEAVVLQYDVVDDYRTIFKPQVFNASMDVRMPRIVWAHDWAEPLGRYTKYIDGKRSLSLVGEFDDFDAVPRARQGWHQLTSGTIDQFSVGFLPEEMGVEQVALGNGGEQTTAVDTFIRGRLDEVSLVLVGAVPGTALTSVRERPRIVAVRQPSVIDADMAAGIILDLQNGKLGYVDALIAIKEGAVITVADAPKPEGEQAPTSPPPGETTPESPAVPPTEAPVVAPTVPPSGDPVIVDPNAPADEIDADMEALEADIAEALALVEAHT